MIDKLIVAIHLDDQDDVSQHEQHQEEIFQQSEEIEVDITEQTVSVSEQTAEETVSSSTSDSHFDDQLSELDSQQLEEELRHTMEQLDGEIA